MISKRRVSGENNGRYLLYVAKGRKKFYNPTTGKYGYAHVGTDHWFDLLNNGYKLVSNLVSPDNDIV